MEKSNLNKVIGMFKIAYPYYFKDLSEDEFITFTSLYQNKLSRYDNSIVLKAIDEIIETSTFMPSVSEVLVKCDKLQKKYYKKILDEMYKQKYFKTDEEYGKALSWLFEEKPIIPEWLKIDMEKFRNKLIESKKGIEKK